MIGAFTFSKNAASQRVFEKNGFQLEKFGFVDLIGEENYNCFVDSIYCTTAVLLSMPQTMPYPSTGRCEPQNLNEQVGMNFAQANANAGNVIIKSLNDPRMPGWLGWQKYQILYPGTGVNIHYVGNRYFPFFFDFKFKD